MNREERRKLGLSKETSDKLDDLKEPCTILEAVQLAQGVAEDCVSRYHENINPIIVSLSIQIEVLKQMLFEEKTGILSENRFQELFQKRVDEYTKQRDEAINLMTEKVNSKFPKTDVIAGDTEIKVSK